MRVPPYACVDAPIEPPTGPRDDLNRAGRAVPLLHLVLRELGDLPLVLLELAGDADDRKPERILHDRIEIEEVVLVRQRRLLDVRAVRAVGVLLDERLPLRPPARRHAERVHAGRANRPAIGHRPQIAAADEVEARVIEVVVGPVVDRDALRRQAVPAPRC